MIDVLLLGIGAMVPLPERPLSSLLLRTNGDLVLCDCGEGTQVQMRRFRTGFRELGTICLTHMHADHVAGLPGLFHTVANAGRTEPMDIYGPPGTIAVVQGLRAIAPYLPYQMTIHELQPGDRFDLDNGLRMTVAAGNHRIPCLAYRFDRDRQPAFNPEAARALDVPVNRWSTLQRGESVEIQGRIVTPGDVLGPPRRGIAVGFATDTRPTAEIVQVMRNVDLLVAESTYSRDEDREKAMERGHMTLREACGLATDVNAGELWLTHFGGTIEHPETLAGPARALFPNARVGYPGLKRTISFPDD